jgi:hypothetical protein
MYTSTMTREEFRVVASDIDRAASQQRINLAEPANTFTVWCENERGSGEYALLGTAASLQRAMALAGQLEAVIRTTQIGRVQIVVWKDGKWFDAYADELPFGGG